MNLTIDYLGCLLLNHADAKLLLNYLLLLLGRGHTNNDVFSIFRPLLYSLVGHFQNRNCPQTKPRGQGIVNPVQGGQYVSFVTSHWRIEGGGKGALPPPP